jgi:hypothetical protein
MKPKEPFRISDYVTFHTQYGTTTGIIENIILKNPQVAIITMRTLHGKPKRYTRPLYKLKHLK